MRLGIIEEQGKMNIDFGSQLPQGKTFAIVLVMRYPNGEPRGSKYYESDRASDICEFYDKNTQPKGFKKQKKDEATIEAN